MAGAGVAAPDVDVAAATAAATEAIEGEAEAEDEKEAIAEGEDVTSAEEADGDEDAEGTGQDLEGLLADLTPEQTKAVLAALPKEVRAAALADDLRAAEMRGRTRREEVETAEQEYGSAYRTLKEYGTRAEQGLAQRINAVGDVQKSIKKALEDFDYDEVAALAEQLPTNTQEWAQLVEAYKSGGIASAGESYMTDMQQLRKQYAEDLKDLPPEVEKKLEEAHYHTARHGGLREAMVITEIVADRRARRAETVGVEKGKTAVNPELMKRIAEIKATTSNVAPRVRGSAAVDQSFATLEHKFGQGTATPAEEASYKRMRRERGID